MVLYISVMSTVTFPFSFLMLLIWALSCTFSKNQLLVSLMFYIVFFISISLTSFLIFVIYFLLLALDFVSRSLVALDVRLGCLRFFFVCFLSYFLRSFLLSSPAGTHIMQMLVHLMSQKSLRLSSFHSFFFILFCSSDFHHSAFQFAYLFFCLNLLFYRFLLVYFSFQLLCCSSQCICYLVLLSLC